MPTVILLSSLLSAALSAPGSADAATPWPLAAGTRVELRLETPIDTRSAASGTAIELRLIGGDCSDGLRLRGGGTVPGRIVHAQKAGAFGKPAELLLAAGPWTPPGGSAPLAFRALAPRTGGDRNNAVLGASFAISVFAGFIHGGNVVLPAGTPLVAEVRSTVDVPAAALEPCDAEASNPESTTHPQGEPHVEPHPDEPRPDADARTEHDGVSADLPLAGERSDARTGPRRSG